LPTTSSARRLGVLIAVGLLATPLSAQQPTFRSGVRLVETSVIVHDRSGQPVSDLKASDFKIFEDGKEQKIEVFSLADARPRAGTKPPLSLPAGVYSNRADAQKAGSVTAILFDRLNSGFDEQKIARDQIIRYLAKLQPTDKIALYVLESDRITVLHDFSSDTALLIARLNSYIASTTTEFARSQEQKASFAPMQDPDENDDTEAWLTRTMEAVQAHYLARRAASTTGALEVIANHLAGIPGRKNLVWVSSAFPFVFKDELGMPRRMTAPVNRATRAINAANVAIYPVDIRGLLGAFVNQTTASATIQRGAFGAGNEPQTPIFNTLQSVSANQDTMRAFAAETGGRVFVNSNAIGEGVGKAMDDARVAYVIGYYSARADDKFHEIDVKVSRGGLDVRHRKGYLALSPPPLAELTSRLVVLDRVMVSPVAATGIELMAGFDRSGDQGTLTVKLSPELVTWQMEQGLRRGAIDIVIAQSTPDGRYFKVKETRVNLTANPEQFKQMLDEGFTMSSAVKLEPAAYRIHVVVSDVTSQAVGSLIIPLQR
jgi:VWFA-related protein